MGLKWSLDEHLLRTEKIVSENLQFSILAYWKDCVWESPIPNSFSSQPAAARIWRYNVSAKGKPLAFQFYFGFSFPWKASGCCIPPFSLIRDFGLKTNHQPLVWPCNLLYVMLSGWDWWFSIRPVNNMQDWRKFLKRFRGCFVFQSCVSTKTVVSFHKMQRLLRVWLNIINSSFGLVSMRPQWPNLFRSFITYNRKSLGDCDVDLSLVRQD